MTKDEVVQEVLETMVNANPDDIEMFLVTLIGLAGAELLKYRSMLARFDMDTDGVNRLLLVIDTLVGYELNKMME